MERSAGEETKSDLRNWKKVDRKSEWPSDSTPSVAFFGFKSLLFSHFGRSV